MCCTAQYDEERVKQRKNKKKTDENKGQREREGESNRIRRPKENELNYNIICTNVIKTNQSSNCGKKTYARIESSNRTNERKKDK